MKRLVVLTLLLLMTSISVAGDPWYKPNDPTLKDVQWRFWVGAVINPEGIGPKMDLEGRWGQRWGVKIGLGFPKVQDVSCAGKDFFCPALHGGGVQTLNYSREPLIEYHTEQDWSWDIMFSWTIRQRGEK